MMKGVESVTVDVRTRTLLVVHDFDQVSPHTLAQCIRGAGWIPSIPSSGASRGSLPSSPLSPPSILIILLQEMQMKNCCGGGSGDFGRALCSLSQSLFAHTFYLLYLELKTSYRKMLLLVLFFYFIIFFLPYLLKFRLASWRSGIVDLRNAYPIHNFRETLRIRSEIVIARAQSERRYACDAQFERGVRVFACVCDRFSCEAAA
jgi:hypothetical protein